MDDFGVSRMKLRLGNVGQRWCSVWHTLVSTVDLTNQCPERQWKTRAGLASFRGSSAIGCLHLEPSKSKCWVCFGDSEVPTSCVMQPGEHEGSGNRLERAWHKNPTEFFQRSGNVSLGQEMTFSMLYGDVLYAWQSVNLNHAHWKPSTCMYPMYLSTRKGSQSFCHL